MPTEKMLSVYPYVRRVSREWNNLILEGITEEEKKIFCEVLLRIEANAKSAIRDIERKKK